MIGEKTAAGEVWAIGVDLGGTKTDIALVDGSGRFHRRERQPTRIGGGPAAIERGIVSAIRRLRRAEPKAVLAGAAALAMPAVSPSRRP